MKTTSTYYLPMILALLTTLSFGSERQWWKKIKHQPLSTLIENSIVSNKTLESARRQAEQINAQAGLTRSLLFPNISANSRVNHQPLTDQTTGAPIGASTPNSTSEETITTSGVTLDARYQLDVWGEEFQQFQAAKLLANAASMDCENRKLSLSIQVATLYIDAIYAHLQINLLMEQLANVKEQLELTRKRYIRGQGSSLALLQQKQQVANLESSLLPVRLQKQVFTERLGAMTGMKNTNVATLISESFPQLNSLNNIDKNVENRPDLQAARLRTEASLRNYKKTIFKSLPTVNITGNIGKSWSDPGIDTWDDTWSIGASVSLPLFTGGTIMYGVKESKASYLSSKSLFEQMIIDANVALSSAQQESITYEDQAVILIKQVEAAHAVYNEALHQYRSGLTGYSDVLIAQNSVQQTESIQLQNERNRRNALLQLVLAAGGEVLESKGDSE